MKFDPTLVRGMSYYTGQSLKSPWMSSAALSEAADATTR